MWACVVLSDSDVLVGIFEDGATVMVYIQVVGGGKNGDYGRELLCGRLAEHSIPAEYQNGVYSR